MSAAETIPMVHKRTAYHRFAPWGSAIEDSKNGWLCRLLAWGATSDSKQEAKGERLRLTHYLRYEVWARCATYCLQHAC